MEFKAQKIVDIVADYENNNMTVDHLLDWVSQFDARDQEFIFDELLVIFEKTYLSKYKCKKMLFAYIQQLAKERKYSDVPAFLRDTVFLDLQGEEKSQKELLSLLEEILKEEYKLTLADCGYKQRYFVYLDDVLSTGNTIVRDLHDWLKADDVVGHSTNFEYLKNHSLKLSVCLICTHFWGQSNVEYRLMQDVNPETKKHIEYYRFYAIENNLKTFNAALNNMVPIDHQLPEAGEYLNSLEDANFNADRAYRKPAQPGKYEKLFSSPESRDRLETIFLKKGIEILNRVQNLSVKQIRPLGYTIKSHKTFGLGTLFFTYRNIPNNCPIVFWWGSNSWRPLFVLKNRGKN